jgi:hypothetical protein
MHEILRDLNRVGYKRVRTQSIEKLLRTRDGLPSYLQ